MSVVAEIERLQTAKADIKAAIEGKGVDVGDGTISTYAKKIQSIPTTGGDMQVAYNEGYTDGKQAEHKAFWDAFQLNGTKTNYYNAFANGHWYDSIYDPQHDITCKGDSANATNMFYNARAITDTLKPILVTGIGLNGTFYGCATLKKIVLLGLYNVPSIAANSFRSCSVLEYIRIDGNLDVTINLQWSPNLDVESAKDVIAHLTNYVGTDNELSYTITFNDTVWTALNKSGNPPVDGYSDWKKYVTDELGWNT